MHTIGRAFFFLGPFRIQIMPSNRIVKVGTAASTWLFSRKKKVNPGVVMEFKVASSEKELPVKAREAWQQIEEKAYTAAFIQRDVKDVWKYGIAFCGKKLAVYMNPYST